MKTRFSLVLLGLSCIAGALAAQTVSSPRIQEIRRQVDAGRTNTADFWSAIAKEGTPLVEPLDANYDLVTFLWRAEPGTRNVYLVASLGVPDGPNDAL
ncbi:MAG TPA: hypothetical protein VK571_04745, partial [Gemmatimonadaceae bacterium]|nr:hypothetical protein [Gemmatimonadaceae bacterium]